MIQLVTPHDTRSESAALIRSILRERPTTSDLTVYWGVSGPVIDGVLGSGLAKGTIEQYQALDEAELAHPPIILNLNDAWAQAGPKVVWGRKNKHTQGRDIIEFGMFGDVGSQRLRAWAASDYWLVPLDLREEWRIHIVKGRAIARGRKVPVGPHIVNPIIRSRRNGWRLDHTFEPPRGMRVFAKRCVEAVGYSLGAVDIGVLEDGTHVCLEVNRAPGCDNYTASAYANAFITIAEGRW